MNVMHGSQSLTLEGSSERLDVDCCNAPKSPSSYVGELLQRQAVVEEDAFRGSATMQ